MHLFTGFTGHLFGLCWFISIFFKWEFVLSSIPIFPIYLEIVIPCIATFPNDLQAETYFKFIVKYSK